jgi:tetratricopeptide (TPR) repeat protein
MKQAEECLTRAIEIDPGAWMAYFLRGVARHRSGDPDGALADYDESIRLYPDLVNAYYNRMLLLEDRGDLDGAIRDQTARIRLEPTIVGHSLVRAQLHVKKGDRDGAIDDCESLMSRRDATPEDLAEARRILETLGHR